MNSLQFPDMLSTSKTNVVSDREATLSNLKLSLLSFKGELFGDPYFGSNLAKVIYDNGGSILKDIVIDDIYSTICTFTPQVDVKREDIDISIDGTKINASIKAKNSPSYVTDMYNICLTGSEQDF